MPQSRGGRASIPGPPKVTQVTALSPGPGPPKVTSHGPFSRPRPPKSHKSRPFLPTQAPQKSQVTALSPGPKTQKSRLNSRPRPPKPKSHASIPGRSGLNPRPPKSHASHGPFSWPRPPKSHKLRPFLPAQAPQKSQVTALSPGPGPPKVTSHGPFSRPQNPKVTPQFPAHGPQNPKVTPQFPLGPKTQKSRLNSRPNHPESHKSRPVFPASASQKSRLDPPSSCRVFPSRPPEPPSPASPSSPSLTPSSSPSPPPQSCSPPLLSLHSERLAKINEDVEEGHNERLATREGSGVPRKGGDAGHSRATAAEGTPDSYLHSYRTPLSCLSRRPACSEDGDDNEPGSKKRVRGLGGEGKAYTRHSLPAP